MVAGIAGIAGIVQFVRVVTFELHALHLHNSVRHNIENGFELFNVWSLAEMYVQSDFPDKISISREKVRRGYVLLVAQMKRLQIVTRRHSRNDVVEEFAR